MQRLARRAEEAVVGDLLDERVVERVDGLGAAGELVHEVQPRQLGQVGGDRAGTAPDRLQQRARELAPEHGRRLQEALLGVGQPVDPRGEHRAQRVGDARRLGQVPLLGHRPRQLLEEERVTVRPVEDGAHERLRQLRAGDHVAHQREAVALAQRRQHDRRHALRRTPAGPPVRPVGGDEQHRGVLQVVDEPREVLVGRRVDPVQVLDDDQQRPPAAGLEQHETQRVQRALAHALQRRVVERGEAVLDAEQLQQQRRALLGVQSQRLQRRARLGRHRVRRVALLDAALAAHEIEDRQVGNRRAVRAAARLQRRHLDAAERAPELVEQPRLAAAGVADDAHQAAASGLRRGQQLAEPAQLDLAPHEATECALGRALERRLARRQADDLVGRHRIALAHDGERAGRQQPQLAPHQARGGLGDQDLAGRGGLL